MAKYKVLQHFTWGKLSLDKGKTVLIDDLGKNEIGNETSVVYKEYKSEEKQIISTKAIASMIKMKKIDETT